MPILPSTQKIVQMKYNIGCLIIFIISQCIVAQDDGVEISVHQTQAELTFYALNNTETRQEVNLTISVKNLMGYHGPITKIISAKDSVEMTKLTIQKNNPWSYETSYTYSAKPTTEENEISNKQLRLELLEFLDAKNNPVIVFYGEDCPRSAYAREILEKKRISFKYLNATRDEHYKKAMFELLKLQEPNIKRVQYPVFLVDNKLNHDIENLRWYINKLALEKK